MKIENIQDYNKKIKELVAEESYREASELVDELLEIKADDIFFNTYRIFLDFITRGFDLMVDELRSQNLSYEDVAENNALGKIAMFFMRKQDYQKAEEVLGFKLGTNLYDNWGYDLLIACYLRQGKFDDAVETVEKIFEEDLTCGNTPKKITVLANSLIDSREYDKANELLDIAIEKYPEDTYFPKLLAKVRRHKAYNEIEDSGKAPKLEQSRPEENTEIFWVDEVSARKSGRPAYKSVDTDYFWGDKVEEWRPSDSVAAR